MLNYEHKGLKRCAKSVAALFAGVILLSSSALATGTTTTLSLNYDNEFSNGTPPTGPAPWLNAVFSSSSLTPGTVTLTLTTKDFGGSEFVSGWYFNLGNASDSLHPLNPNSLIITETGSSGAFTAPGISTGANAFKADGDGKYDILFSFATAGGLAQRFTAGDSVTFTITGIAGLDAADFDTKSAPSGGHGPFYSAAHVQAIPGIPGGLAGSFSGWVDPTTGTVDTHDNTPPSTPDGGSTIALLGSALLGLGVLGRKLRRS